MIEMDDGTRRLASHRDRTALDARLVHVMPRDSVSPAPETGVEQGRDLAARLAACSTRPACAAWCSAGSICRRLPLRESPESEADALLESVVQAVESASEPIPGNCRSSWLSLAQQL